MAAVLLLHLAFHLGSDSFLYSLLLAIDSQIYSLGLTGIRVLPITLGLLTHESLLGLLICLELLFFLLFLLTDELSFFLGEIVLDLGLVVGLLLTG